MKNTTARFYFLRVGLFELSSSHASWDTANITTVSCVREAHLVYSKCSNNNSAPKTFRKLSILSFFIKFHWIIIAHLRASVNRIRKGQGGRTLGTLSASSTNQGILTALSLRMHMMERRVLQNFPPPFSLSLPPLLSLFFKWQHFMPALHLPLTKGITCVCAGLLELACAPPPSLSVSLSSILYVCVCAHFLCLSHPFLPPYSGIQPTHRHPSSPHDRSWFSESGVHPAHTMAAAAGALSRSLWLSSLREEEKRRGGEEKRGKERRGGAAQITNWSDR